MWVVRTLMLFMTAAAVSGCAGGRVRQDLARLQSQVGMLDERVTQLERSSAAGVSASSMGSMGVETAPLEGTGQAEKSPSVKGKGAVAPSAKASTRDIQQALNNAGFYQGPIDDKMGPLTRAAIKDFQRVHGLNDDGVVGKQTWAKLRPYVDLSSGSRESNAAKDLK